MDDDVQPLPLVGSIQNSVGMGFLGNQAAFAVANALGARLVHAQSHFANAHAGVAGRTSLITDLPQFRRDVDFVIRARPAVLHVGYLPKPTHVEVVASALEGYKGVVLVDPVIGDYKKGLYVSEETARAIGELLVPHAQIVTPNRFEAEVLLGTVDRTLSEHAYLNGIFDLGPSAVIVTSFESDPEKHRTTALFTNGYYYHRINGPLFARFSAHGAGDVFAASVATFVALGGSPFAAALLATALTARAVADTTSYGGFTCDPIAALAKWNPLGYQVDDDRTMRFCERSSVGTEALKPTAADSPRLKFAPPRHKSIYG